jgi:collagen type I alpha
MRKIRLRYFGTLTGLLGPLLAQSCQDQVELCSTATAPDGTTTMVCNDVGALGQTTLAVRRAEPAGEACPNGGERIDTGFDDNENNVLDAAEIDVSAYICDGVDGDDGPEGNDGAPGAPALVLVDAEGPGENCGSGGVRIRYGVDENGDGTLQARETEGTRYVCDGITGEDGTDGDDGEGINSLVVTSRLDGANETCQFGGVLLEVGLDDGASGATGAVARDGILQPAEVDYSNSACDAEGDTGATGPDGADGRDGDAGSIGPTGANGFNGATGTNGFNGATGHDGTNGSAGATGHDGINGSTGATGQNGPNGATGGNGLDGSTGATGTNGTNGTNGATGGNGLDGSTGATGTNGTNGATGATGGNGLDGSTGSTGQNGTNGATGSTGATGGNGLDGSTGATGQNGATGATGGNGLDGSTGATGTNGSTGATGGNGIDGNTGPTGQNGNTGATGGNGNTGATGGNGIDGATGSTGSTGATGDSPAGIATSAFAFSSFADGAAATVATSADVPFLSNGPIDGITHIAGQEEFTITRAGSYFIVYNLNVTANTGLVALANNGDIDASSEIPTITGNLSGQAVMDLAVGDVVTLHVISGSLTLDVTPRVGVSISIIQLDDAN